MLKCAQHGYRLILELVDTHSDHIERELLGAIAALQPDGVILTPPHSENPLIIDLLVAHNISFARIGSVRPGPGFALTMDDERAARLATEHLIELGHRRIGFIAGPDDYELSGWRVDGWRDAMATAGLATDGLLAQGDFSYATGRAAAAALLDHRDPPTAIIASNDQMTLATLAYARDRGISVPDELSLISFDDTPIVRFTHPSLTAVVQPIAEVSEKAVELIIADQFDTAGTDHPIVVPARLERRDSTVPPKSRSAPDPAT
jgi:LacI family transcriptional regulator